MTPNSFNEVSILIVDDDDVDATSIMRAFKKFRVINPILRAKNGAEAIEVLKSDKMHKPWIILLDLNMPKMSGIEFLEAARDDNYLANSVVFVLTTSESEKDISAAYEKNVAGYIVKSNLDKDFQALIDMLNAYWKVIELPHEVGGLSANIAHR